MLLVRILQPVLHRWRSAVLSGLGGLTILHAAEVPVPFTADHSEHDFTTGIHHLIGNVDINVPGLVRLQCDDFIGAVPVDSADATNAVMTAHGNVRLHMTSKARGTNPPVQILALADHAVYTGTNELFTLTGNPRVITAYGTLFGTIIRYDVAANKATAEPWRFLPAPTMLTNLMDRARPKSPASRDEAK